MTKRKIKAVLIDVVDPEVPKSMIERRLEELSCLVNTYGGIVVVKTIQKKALPDYSTYIGKGKVKEIAEIAKKNKANVLIVNNILKPRQIFELNEILREAKVEAWDRVDLILKIFDKHAKSTEAKLQIELASIRHMGPRIYGMGIELSRQAGAMGVRAGAGETNIEVMKRHLRKQELNILKKIDKYQKIREGQRNRRKKKNFKTVALVGYTNAGKSSLLTALTGKETYVADQLFATLSTKIGKLFIPGTKYSDEGQYVGGKEVLISDTIGFIQNLPPKLIQAFKSTLAETVEADIMLHVIDINDPELHEKIVCVDEILEDLGLHNKPKIYAFNKVDLIGPKNLFDPPDENAKKTTLMKAGKDTVELLGWSDPKSRLEAMFIIKELGNLYKEFNPIFVSANEKMNLETLIDTISKKV